MKTNSLFFDYRNNFNEYIGVLDDDGKFDLTKHHESPSNNFLSEPFQSESSIFLRFLQKENCHSRGFDQLIKSTIFAQVSSKKEFTRICKKEHIFLNI